MKFIKWHLLNLVSNILGLGILCATGAIVFQKAVNEVDQGFFFKSWWHTVGLIVLLWIVIGFIMGMIEELKPAEHTQKREDKELARKARKAEKSSLPKPIKNSQDSSGIFPAISLLGIFYVIFGRPWATDRYRVQTWSSRKGTRGGSSAVYGDRDTAINVAYNGFERNPKGEVIVTDQKTKNTILRLP